MVEETATASTCFHLIAAVNTAREPRVQDPRRPRQPLRGGRLASGDPAEAGRRAGKLSRGRASLLAGSLTRATASRCEASAERYENDPGDRVECASDPPAEHRSCARDRDGVQREPAKVGRAEQKAQCEQRDERRAPLRRELGERLAKNTAIFGLPRLLRRPWRNARVAAVVSFPAPRRGRMLVAPDGGDERLQRDRPRGGPAQTVLMNPGSDALRRATIPALAAIVHTACPADTPPAWRCHRSVRRRACS